MPYQWFHSSWRLMLICGLVLAAGTLAAEENMPPVEHARNLSQAFRHAAERATPSVVTIVSKYKLQPSERDQALRELLEDPRFRGLFPDGRSPFPIPGEGEGEGEEQPGFEATNVGSGVVIDESGIILTNSHVVADAEEVLVRFADGSEVVAEEVKTDPRSDVATLRIKPETKLHAAALGDSDALDIGDWVIAIGSPFELETTVSAGIISGKGRGIDKIKRGRLLQTDAAINPGNSGGPLVNLDGEVIGINTAIATSSGGYQGIGFAIPIKRGKWVADELLNNGKVRRAYLGIRIGELTAQAARQLGLSARSGVWVLGIVPDSPAAEAGMTMNDVIISFAGQPTRSPGDLQDAAEQMPIGSKQELVVMRKGEQIKLEVNMVALPDEL